jgi:hypothetical protein
MAATNKYVGKHPNTKLPTDKPTGIQDVLVGGPLQNAVDVSQAEGWKIGSGRDLVGSGGGQPVARLDGNTPGKRVHIDGSLESPPAAMIPTQQS